MANNYIDTIKTPDGVVYDIQTTATTSKSGLMSSKDKAKLDSLSADSMVTGVKGSNETAYKTGNVNLSASNVGAIPTSGGTVTGTISGFKGGSWIYGRDNAVVANTKANTNAFNPVVSSKTSSGSWNMGVLTGNESLVFSYDTDTDHTAGTNNYKAAYLPNKGGTIAYTSDITKKAVGLDNVANYNQSKAVSNITRSGKTFTMTHLDGTTSTFDQQDTTYTALPNPNSLTVQFKGANKVVYNGSQAKTLNITANDIGALPTSGGTMTGALTLQGEAASNLLKTRSITGISNNGSEQALYINYQSGGKIYLGKTAAYYISEDGSSYTGNASTSTKLKAGRSFKVALNKTDAKSFDGSADATDIGVSGTLPITNGGTGSNTQMGALKSLNSIGVYARSQIGDTPNFDDPGVNGQFEIRTTYETPKATGSRPFQGYGSFLSLKTPDNVAMMQLSGNNDGWYIRGKQAANVTMSGLEWQKIITSANIGDQTVASAKNASSVAWANVSGHPTALSQFSNDKGYITSTEAQNKINTAVSAAYKYKGSVASDKLPTSGQVVGDVYNITNDSSYGKAGMNVAWNGTTWDALGSNVDLSNYVKTDDSRLSDARKASDVSSWAKKGSLSEAINADLTISTSDPVDGDYYIAQYAGGGTTTTTYHRRSVTSLWNYMKGKIKSDLGLDATSYNGKAAMVKDSSDGNAITITYGKAAQTSTSWLASWNGREIGSISPNSLKVGDSDKVDGYHETSFLRFRGKATANQEDTLWNQIGIKEYGGYLPSGITDSYNYGAVVSLPGNNPRLDLWYAHTTSESGQGLRYRTGWSTDKRAWATIIDSKNIGSQSVNYATSAGSAGNVTGVVAVANGGTGANNASTARTNLGLGKVENNTNQEIRNMKSGLNANSLQVYAGTPYIDFHFNNSTADYTSHIIEESSGQLNINGVAFKNSQLVKGSVPEAFLSWGGKNIVGDITPVDAAISSFHSANRLAFMNPAGITVEYSNDSGKTWTDYGLSDAGKVSMVSGLGNWVWVGKHSSTNSGKDTDMLRITISASKGGIYTLAKKLLMDVETNGANQCTVSIQRAINTSGTPNYSTLGTYSISGWNGWNSIPLGSFLFGGGDSRTNNYGYLRLTFSQKAGTNTSYKNALAVDKLYLIGTTGWVTPSNMARDNRLYSYDSAQNAIFPASVKATRFQGPADSIRDAGDGNTITINRSASGITSSDWYAAWNGNQLRAIAPSNMTAGKASKLASTRTLQVALGETTAKSFDGSANVTNIGVSGTLPVAHGGTGATSLTSGAALIGNGTSAVQTRTIKNNTTTGALGWASDAASTELVTTNTVAHWNGAYSGTSSNLRYGAKGYIPGTSSSTSLGSTTQPIYINSNGVLATANGEASEAEITAMLKAVYGGTTMTFDDSDAANIKKSVDQAYAEIFG